MQIKELKINDEVSVKVSTQRLRDTDDEKWIYEPIFETAKVVEVDKDGLFASIVFVDGKWGELDKDTEWYPIPIYIKRRHDYDINLARRGVGGMKLKEYQTTSKNADFLITKFLENPGKFASIVLQMYWDAKKERDELIMSNHKVIQDNTKLKRKLDDVVSMVNAHLHHKKAWSDNPYYDRVQQRLNEIMEDE
ncbi:TPA: hypothetical protein ACJI49_002312 [Staphylococcus pseudintermedius]